PRKMDKGRPTPRAAGAERPRATTTRRRAVVREEKALLMPPQTAVERVPPIRRPKSSRAAEMAWADKGELLRAIPTRGQAATVRQALVQRRAGSAGVPSMLPDGMSRPESLGKTAIPVRAVVVVVGQRRLHRGVVVAAPEDAAVRVVRAAWAVGRASRF